MTNMGFKCVGLDYICEGLPWYFFVFALLSSSYYYHYIFELKKCSSFENRRLPVMSFE